MQREYDRHILRHAAVVTSCVEENTKAGAIKLAEEGSGSVSPVPNRIGGLNSASSRFARFLRPFNVRPTVIQQMVRGFLYMVQFGAA